MTATTTSPSRIVSPPADAHCLGCGYALRDLTSDRCPECGRQFDAGDPWTMNVGRPYGAIGAFLLSPIGRPTHFAALLATLAVFWWTAGLPYALVAMVIGLVAWSAIYLYRMARGTARWIARRRYRQSKRPARSFILLILITLSGLMVWTRLPLRVLFVLHRPSFERVARYHYEQIPMLAPEPPLRTRVGLYPIEHVYVSVHGARLHSTTGVAFSYYADDELQGYYHDERHIHLGGRGWYYNISPESYILGRPVGYVLDKLFN